MSAGRRDKPFLVEEEEETERFVVVPTTSIETGEVVARAEAEPVGWLLAASLPVALLREDPWVMSADWSEHEFRLRDVVGSGVEMERLGVHVVRDAMEVVVAVTRTPDRLAALLRGAPREVVEEALSQLTELGLTRGE